MGSFWRALPGPWQEKSLIVLGVLLMATPWLLGYSGSVSPTGNAVVIGVVFIVGGVVTIATRTEYADYAVAFLAFWLVLASRILGYDNELMPTLVDIAFGAAGITLAMDSAIVRARARNLASGTAHPFEPPSHPTPRAPGKKAA